MAAPEIEAIYPNDEATGVPLGADIEITFSSGIDLASGKANVVIYGRDFDMTSGPESASWIDSDTGNNPFFLKSPGFTGVVDCDYSLVYVDGSGEEIDSSTTVYDEDEEATGDGTDPYRHKLIISPKNLMATEGEYTVYVIGDSEEGTSKGVSKRTIFDVDDTAATSDTGSFTLYGGYTGSDDTVHIKITAAGDIGAAKYKWWYNSEGESEAREGKITSRRYRRLEDGLQIRFSGSGFEEDDEYTIAVYTSEYMEDSYSFSFSTGTGSITEVPSTASTSVIGTESSLVSDEEALEIVAMTPPNGSTHQSTSTRTIVIEFSGALDDTTITDDTITLLSYPVSGTFSGPSSTGALDPVEMVKGLSVDGNELTIKL